MPSLFKKMFAFISTFLIICSLSLSVIGYCQSDSKEIKINKKPTQEISKLIQNLKDRDPQKSVSQKLGKNKNNESEYSSD